MTSQPTSHEQVILMRLRFKDDSLAQYGRIIFRNVSSLNLLVHDVIRIYYENCCPRENQKYFYVYWIDIKVLYLWWNITQELRLYQFDFHYFAWFGLQGHNMCLYMCVCIYVCMYIYLYIYFVHMYICIL